MNQNQELAQREQQPGTQLQKVQRGSFAATWRPEPLSLGELKDLGEMFLQSKMFDGVENVFQAMVKIKAGEELGFSAFVSMSGIDIIKGKASLGADLQASLIKDSGKYRYHVVEITSQRCEIDFFERVDGKWTTIGKSSFTFEDAVKAKLAGTGGQNQALYDKYSRNMLFSRAMTNGMTWFTPDLMRSAGVREDVTDFDLDRIVSETSETDTNDHVEGEIVEEQLEPDVPQMETISDAQLFDLRIAIDDKLTELTRGNVKEVEKLLKGRDPRQMSKEALVKFLADLNNEIPF